MRLTVTLLLVLCASCGYIGGPMPPALNLPRAVSDLRVQEVGDRVVVQFTTPKLTTEDLAIKQLNEIELLVGPTEAGGAPGSFAPDRWLATAKSYMLPTNELGAVERAVPATEWATGKEMTFAVRTVGSTGRNSDLSNFVSLRVLPPLTQPVVKAENAADGVALTWTGNAESYQIARLVLTDAEPKPELIGETMQPSYVDVNATYGVRYGYVVTGHTGSTVASIPSKQVEITPVDNFAPAVPGGLDAIVSNGAVDLSWSRNTEPDLAGYTVLRAEEDGPFAVYAEGVVLPTFSDKGVQPGKRYRYTITASDKLGNQSGRAAEKAVRIE